MERDRALRPLDRLVGSWKASDPSGRGGISGQTRFEWMKGGNVMLQWIDFGGATGLEVISFDPKSQSLKSRYYDSSGMTLDYTYAVEGDRITISIDMDGRKGQFAGVFASDGASLRGEWNWTDGGRQLSYEALLERMS